ncbi:MAG TPA: hypothetical protein VK716_09950 [Terracidiphilus sp.]|jgi:hypothetical protein|nr:hypothetical protein [Terracidiphilus sp.]
MYALCRHLMPSGVRCQSPALRSKPFCYYHQCFQRSSQVSAFHQDEPLQLSSIEEPYGIQIALSQVLQALASSRIDSRRAGVFLYGLQIASHMASKRPSHLPVEIVRDLSCDDTGAWIAPEKVACEPGIDCRSCPAQEGCCHPGRVKYRNAKRIYTRITQGHDAMDQADRERERETAALAESFDEPKVSKALPLDKPLPSKAQSPQPQIAALPNPGQNDHYEAQELESELATAADFKLYSDEADAWMSEKQEQERIRIQKFLEDYGDQQQQEEYDRLNSWPPTLLEPQKNAKYQTPPIETPGDTSSSQGSSSLIP